MLLYISFRVVSSISAFLYPGYASYKTLSQRPASEEELERWLMYWSVLGCIVGIEYVAEWLISWIPFYYTSKMLFLLYLALPQTRGSTFIYINHLQPFFHAHESQIDAALASLKARVYAFLQDKIRALWDHVVASLGQQPQQQSQAAFVPVGGVSGINTGTPPSMGDPVSGPLQVIASLWHTYGPTIIASGAALARQSVVSTAARSSQSSNQLNSPPTTPPVIVGSPPLVSAKSSAQSIMERRKQLEAELAALDASGLPGDVPLEPVLISGLPQPSSSVASSRASSTSDIHGRSRDRTLSASARFEEIEFPSDAEGYETSGQGDDIGHETGSPSAPVRSNWFGWNSSSSKGGYERLKKD